MPAFSEGMRNVARDEQRHIGFGVKVLSELLAESDECKAAVVEILREMLPYLTSVFIPPNWDEEYTRCYGFTMEEIFAWGMRSVETKWKAIGYPLHEMPAGIYPFDPEMPHEERARAPDQAAQGRRARPAQRAGQELTGGPGDLLRRDRPLGQDRRGGSPRHRPVEVPGRRPVAHRGRQRLEPRRRRASPRRPTSP